MSANFLTIAGLMPDFFGQRQGFSKLCNSVQDEGIAHELGLRRVTMWLIVKRDFITPHDTFDVWAHLLHW